MASELQPHQEHQEDDTLPEGERLIGETTPREVIELNPDGSVKSVEKHTYRLVAKKFPFPIRLVNPEDKE